MTTEEITGIVRFLDLADGVLSGAYCLKESPLAAPDCGIAAAGDAAAAGDTDLAGNGAVVQANSAEVQTNSAAGPTGDDCLELVASDVAACSACGLAALRNKAVPGEGVPNPLVLVIGEGPGADEDREGRPFVGVAGQLLDRMLASIRLDRTKNCFIANTVKCRPPHNRDPLSEETAACAPFLDRQIRLLKPLVILCVGRIAAQTLLKSAEGIGRLRGRFTTYLDIPLLPTYHPSALLRDESLKKPAWEDLKLLREKLSGLDPAYAAECRETPG